MKSLLETVTKETHFYFNNQIYVQHNGVAMGSQLDPLLADIFLVHLEKQLLTQLQTHGLVVWKRYVDDTFAIINDTTDSTVLLNILNSYHPAIQFTKELESHGSLSFLDVKITRLKSPTSYSKSYFKTTIFRKTTYTGLLTKFSSFVPIQYKKKRTQFYDLSRY
jgi:hypothetical protein